MKRTTEEKRRVGLGVGGWADALERIGLEYDSDEARMLASRLASVISREARDESKKIAVAIGKPVNASTTCAQPTGSITPLMGNRGYAIEPFFSQALALSPKAHVKMQAAWQSGIENGISKTVNLHRSCDKGVIRIVILEALKHGCKSVTVYRDRSHEAQPRQLAECKGC
jgi:ribonucleotide reductase alpha subunit